MPKLSTLTIFGIRLATLILVFYGIALFAGTHISRPPNVPMPYGDKLQHYCAFFGLGMLLCWAIPTYGRPARKIAIVLAIAIPYAAFDEWTQRFTATRTVDIKDFLTNTAGILTATACFAAVRSVFLARQQSRQAAATVDRQNAIAPTPQTSAPRR